VHIIMVQWRSERNKLMFPCVESCTARIFSCLVLSNENKEWSVELGGTLEQEESDSSGSSASPQADTFRARSSSAYIRQQLSTDATAANTTSAAPIGVSLEAALPSSVFHFVLSSVEMLLLSDPAVSSGETSAFSGDPYFLSRKPRALLCIPVLRGGVVLGVLYLENDFRRDAFSSSHVQLLQLLCGQGEFV
jgi:GAF domain-containing protein